MRRLVIGTLAGVSITAAVVAAQPPQRGISVGFETLDRFEARLKADPQYVMRLLADDRDRAEALLRAAQKQRPTAQPWAMHMRMLFASDSFVGKSLQGERKAAHFKHALEYLRETYQITVQRLEESPDETLHAALPGLRLSLGRAAVEAGELELAEQHAAETLRNNTDTEKWDYGNIIHNANQILGRCALRNGKLAAAKRYLLAAGATPGSPQLNSFGPKMSLARELAQRGEMETVLKYLDLVAKFWANPDQETRAIFKRCAREHRDQLDAWKKRLRAGNVPDHRNWK